MARTPTIYEIKERTQKKSPYFFNRDSLRFFGQTMRSFRVKKSPKGNIFIFAKGKHGTYTFRQYKDGDLLPIRGSFDLNTERKILDYIARH